MTKIVLGIEGKVLGVGRGEICRKGDNADASLGGKADAVEWCDGIWVCRKAEEGVSIGTGGINDGRVDGGGAAASERRVEDSGWVAVSVAGDGDLFLVVVDAVPAAEDNPAVKARGAPC